MSRSFIVLGAALIVVACQFELSPARAVDENCHPGKDHWPWCGDLKAAMKPEQAEVLKQFSKENGGNMKTDILSLSREIKSSPSKTRDALKFLEDKGVIAVDHQLYEKNQKNQALRQGSITLNPPYRE